MPSKEKVLQIAKWALPVLAVVLGVIALSIFYIVPALVAREVAKVSRYAIHTLRYRYDR